MLRNLGLLSIVAVLGTSISISYGENEYDIPDWIKDLAGFWYNDQISDGEFSQGITFLIENDIIKVSKIEELKAENENLKAENISLQYQLEEMNTDSDSKLRISLHTNKKNYEAKDDIMIFGTVKVGIVISDAKGKILAVAKIEPNVDGSYGFIAKDPIFKEFGEYSVNVYYGGSAYAHTTYTYNPI